MNITVKEPRKLARLEDRTLSTSMESNMTTETGGPAFPTSAHNTQEWASSGMTLRDYFAGKAMQSLIIETGRTLQHCEGINFGGLVIANNEGGTPTDIAVDSYAMADAMLDARKE